MVAESNDNLDRGDAVGPAGPGADTETVGRLSYRHDVTSNQGNEMKGWPRTLAWSNFASIANPGRGQFVALNGHPIVARVAISIMFYAARSPRSADGTRFNTVDVRVETNSLQYVPSRIPQGQEDYYLRHEQGHMDLMGLFARELEVALLGLRATSSADLTQQANAAVDQTVANARMYAINIPRIDCIYDRETNHGMLRHNKAAGMRGSRNIARWREADFHFRMD